MIEGTYYINDRIGYLIQSIALQDKGNHPFTAPLVSPLTICPCKR
jgi:hypothetical protein